MKTKQSIRRLTVAALGTALVCVCTRAIQIPIPLGYAHLGDFAILLFAVYFGPWVGALSAGVGSALADLLSYPERPRSLVFPSRVWWQWYFFM